MAEKTDNIVKQTAKTLGLTYRELGDLLGLSEGHIKRLAVSDEVGEQVVKSIGMLLKIQKLEAQNQEVQEFKKLLKKLTE